MHLLLVFFAVSLFVLLAAAWAIAQAVRRHGKPVAPSPGSLNLDSQPTAQAADDVSETEHL
jgi:hypothetical protein